MLKKALFATVLLAQAFAAAASDYPSKPIKFIIPYPPGGPTDAMARLIQVPLQAKLQQPVIIDNRPGAGGNIGTDFVAKAPADGYTILLAASGPMAVNKTLYRSIPFDAQKDFAPIIQISAFPLVLEVHPSVPAANIKQFLALAKDKPTDLGFASAGNGTPQHLAGELFNTATGLKLQHIPYKGARGADGCDGRPCQGDVRHPWQFGAVHQERQAASAGGHHRYPQPGAAGRADAGRVRFDGLRLFRLAWHRRAGGHAQARDRQAEPGHQ